MKILIIDGDNYTAEALKIALLEVSYSVEIATENLIGWELLDFSAYDLVLLDAGLPNFENLARCRKLKEKGCHIPILLMLDTYDEQDIKNSLEAGVSNCIIKPFDVEDLIVQIDDLLRNTSSSVQPLLTNGSLNLNLKSQKITYYERSVALDIKEVSILELFLRYRTRVFSCHTILDLITYLDSKITKTTVKKIINKLINKLKILGISDPIEKVYCNGYRLRSASIDSVLIEYNYQSTEIKLLPDLWLVSQDIEFISKCLSEAANWGIKTKVIDTVSAAVAEIPNEANNVILLDMSVSNKTEGMREILEEIYIRKTLVSLVAILSQKDVRERLTLSDFYPHAVCYKSASPTEILDLARQISTQCQLSECRILFVDRNRDTLLQVRRLLEPWGFIIVTLEDEVRFWEIMRLFNPELLVLGELKSQNDAFRLCKLLRADSHWETLSILFLVSKLEHSAIAQVFEVGGDDFLSRPIIEAELVNRVLSCSEKAKLSRSCIQANTVTQVYNRDESTKDLEKLLHLARRQNQTLSLVVLYIYNFSEIQKVFGYVSINEVLQFINSFLQESLRTEDVVVCWGEEFVVSMYGINKVDAVERLNKILLNIRDRQFTASNGIKFSVDCSIAVGQYPQDGTDINALYQFTKNNLRERGN